MANNCYNTITFSGKDLTEINKLIKEGVDASSNQGWLPKEAPKELTKWLFNIEDLSEEMLGYLQIQCWTKWTPPLEELKFICKLAKVSCECWYDESGDCIYGQYSYDFDSDIERDIFLEQSDLDRITFDPDLDQHYLDGVAVESDYTCYLDMLDDKINKLYIPQTT
jgi:hypothetical protein